MARILAGAVVQCLLFTILTFGPALAFGASFKWPRGLVGLGLLATVSVAGALWLQKTDPGLARERASAPRAQTRSDAAVMLLIAASVVGWFTLVSWDVHRAHLPTLVSGLSLALGMLVFLAGTAVIVWTFRVNSFAVTVVRVQEEREQRVIDRGPYGLVRHPMYMGALMFFAGLGLILGSTVSAVVAVPLFALAFTPRMIIEEAALRRSLPGYADYQSRVRARLVPRLL